MFKSPESTGRSRYDEWVGWYTGNLTSKIFEDPEEVTEKFLPNGVTLKMGKGVLGTYT